MKDYLERIKEGNYSATELALTGICLFLAGVVIGMLLAPARCVTLGSFNGNNGSIEKPKKKGKKK